jgi:hypothetical protein
VIHELHELDEVLDEEVVFDEMGLLVFVVLVLFVELVLLIFTIFAGVLSPIVVRTI